MKRAGSTVTRFHRFRKKRWVIQGVHPGGSRKRWNRVTVEPLVGEHFLQESADSEAANALEHGSKACE